MPDHDVTARNALIVDVLRFMRTARPDELPPSQEDNVRAMLMAYLPGPRQGDLFEPEPSCEGDRLVRAATAMVGGEADRHDLSLAQAIKAAIIIGHVRAGRWDRLHDAETLAVADVLGLKVPRGAFGDAPPEVVTTVRPDDGPVEFVFSWRTRTAWRKGVLGTSTAHADLVEVNSTDAPMACSLWTPEERLTLRRLDSTWLRPVLSPGSWKPATTAEFRDAVRSGVAWRDNPFLPSLRGLPTFHIRDLAGPQPLNGTNVRRVSDARDACLVSAGQLHVIDGIVHRSTGAPTVGIGTTFRNGKPVTGPAWKVDDLGSTRDMGSFGEVAVATWFNGVPIPDRSGMTDPDRAFIPLSDWDGVARLLRVDGGRLLEPAGSHTPAVADLAWPSETLSASSDVRACFDVAARLAARLLPVTHILDGTAGRGDPCVRLGRILARRTADDGGLPGEGDPFLSLIQTMCADALDVVRKAADPRGGMWLYVCALVAYAAAGRPSSPAADPDLATVRL